MKNKINLIKFILFVLLTSTLSGCFLLVIPGAALIGHTIQKSNQEYDDIIVNMGYKYKIYYDDMIKTNKENVSLGKPQEKILQFTDWMDTQVKNERERKAVARYKRIH